MRKNRAIQVSLVKKDPETTTEEKVSDTTADVVATTTIAVEKIVEDVTKLVVLYVAADTARKVVLALISKI